MKWLLPALFIVYYSSISLFMHVHVEDGTTIVHSHPFKKTADGTCHHHSSLSEIQLFHLLTTVHVQDGAICSLLLQFYATPSYKIIENPACLDHLLPVLGKLSLRAPPPFFLSRWHLSVGRRMNEKSFIFRKILKINFQLLSLCENKFSLAGK